MSKILCVDLDGTLLHNDSLYPAIFRFIKANPINLFVLLAWLCRGRAYMKQQLARKVILDPSVLPYNMELLDWLKTCKDQGRTLVLVTAADHAYAALVADHLGIFDEIIASDGQINLRAGQKAAALNKRFGFKAYDYAGNSHDDLAVWCDAHGVIVVNASKRLLTKIHKHLVVDKIFERPSRALKKVLRKNDPSMHSDDL